MSSVNSSSPRPRPDRLEITNWPLRDDGVVSFVVVLLWIAMTGAAAYSSQSFAMTAFVSLALMATLWRFWIPVRYEVASQGVTRTLLGWRRRVPWTAVAAYCVHRRGIQLLPQDDDSPLAMIQGWYIRWNDQRELLVQLVEHYHARAAACHWAESRSSRARPRSSSLGASAGASGVESVETSGSREASTASRRSTDASQASEVPRPSPPSPSVPTPPDATVVRKNENHRTDKSS